MISIFWYIYVCLSFVLCGVFEPGSLAGDYSPIHTLAVRLSGPGLGAFVSVIGVLIMVAMANSGLLYSLVPLPLASWYSPLVPWCAF